tara:strand:+ start:837 stop:1394 length:558 start_codon:yes stop_codon:yes gene_type:complete
MIQFYKPNAKNTGSACSFWVNRDGSVMASLIKQASWDSQRKIGSFSKNKENPKGRVITKLSRTEVGGILDSIESNREFSAYHSSQKQVVQMKFGPYMRGDSQVGFSYSVNKQDKEDSTFKASFVIGFTFPEARVLKHDLQNFLDKTAPSLQNNQEEESPVKVVDLEEPPQAQAQSSENSDEEIPW